MTWALSLVGAGLVLFVLRDVFHTLWHPTRHGGLSRLVMRAVWRLWARPGATVRRVSLAGPTGMMTVVAIWSLLVAVGCALMYWPHMPGDFSYSSGLAPSSHAGPLDALYVSLVTLATLGLGDIVPTSGWLRVLAPIEALVGFALLSATVAWILGVYPALARRRALALRLSHLRRSRATARALDTDGSAALIDALATAFATVTVDFLQYAESYYFYDGEEHISLPAQLPYATRLAAQAAQARHPDVRVAGAALRTALDDLAGVLDARFLRTGGAPEGVFAAYAADHGRGRSSEGGGDPSASRGS
ncbi:potassium channel family protein [Streptomyces sp. NPDC004327]|uniref:potassium channel family protein n=1 Tax=Streptomyces sp. NPDC004327 TaxID=3364699 RepID=UPI0036D07370